MIHSILNRETGSVLKFIVSEIAFMNLRIIIIQAIGQDNRVYHP
jgi:hypothetical protein